MSSVKEPLAPQTLAAVSLPELFPELLEAIFSFIEDRRDLCSVCLACSRMLDSAQRQLYRTILPVHTRDIVRVCMSILRKPHLARCVRSLQVVLQQEIILPCAPGRIRLFFRTLRLLTGLTNLAYVDPCPKTRASARDNLMRCNITLGNAEQASYTQRSKARVPDLTSKINITSVILHDSLHNLHILRTNHELALALVPRRPVAELVVVEELHSDAFLRTLPMLGLSSGLLRSLDVQIDLLDLDVLTQLCQHLSNLLLLTLKLPWRCDLKPLFESSAANLDIEFPSFRCLETLKILGPPTIHITAADCRPFVVGVGRASPGLTEVLFAGKLPAANFALARLAFVHFRRKGGEKGTEGSAGPMPWTAQSSSI